MTGPVEPGAAEASAAEASAEEPHAGQARAAEVVAITAFWTGLGLDGLIDVHTHFMPPNVMAKVWAYFDAAAEAGRTEWPITYRLPDDERVGLLRSFGVRRFSALSYPHRPGMAAWLNEWSAGFAARVPDSLPSATFFPEPDAGAYVARALASGTQIFKAHVQVGAYDPRDSLLDPVWGLLAEAGVPVVVHCGSGPFPGEHTGPGPFREVLARHPALTAIIAHGGAPEYSDFLDLAEAYPGVYLDTTMVFTDYLEEIAPFPPSERPRLTDLGGKILLGTDFPNIPYPYLTQLQALQRLDLGTGWLRAVCHHNAAALFHL